LLKEGMKKMFLMLRAKLKLQKDVEHWGYCFRRPFSFDVPKIWQRRRLKYWDRLSRLSRGLKAF